MPSRRRRHPGLRLAFAAPWVLLAVACGAPPSVVRTEVWSISETGMTLAPPGSDAPVVSSEAAYAQCLTGAASCASGPPTRIELTKVTDTGTNMIDPDGALMWAIEWIAIPCPLSRGPGPYVPDASDPTATPKSTPIPMCDEIAFVDAHTGSFIQGYVGPHS